MIDSYNFTLKYCFRWSLLLSVPIFCMGLRVNAQLSTGSSFFIKKGTILSTDGLNLKPDLDLDFSNQTVLKSATPATATDPGSLGSIAAVYSLSHPLSFKGELGIRYKDEELNANTPELLALAYHDGITGFSVENILTMSNDDHLVWGLTGINTINLAKLTAVNTGVLLPIKLAYFRGVVTPASVTLSWATEHELNNDHFEIERSADGKQFAFLAKEMSKGNSTVRTTYEYKDNSPIPGRNYYRLKQINQDASVSYSDIINLVYNAIGDNQVQVYPNPASQALNVALSNSLAQTASITIVDAAGKQLIQVAAIKPGNRITRIDVSALPAGIYYVVIESQGSKFSKTISIVR